MPKNPKLSKLWQNTISPPYNIGSTSVTFAEVYQKWTEKRFPDVEVPNTYTAAYKQFPNLYDMAFVDVRKRHMQG